MSQIQEDYLDQCLKKQTKLSKSSLFNVENLFFKRKGIRTETIKVLEEQKVERIQGDYEAGLLILEQRNDFYSQLVPKFRLINMAVADKHFQIFDTIPRIDIHHIIVFLHIIIYFYIYLIYMYVYRRSQCQKR